MTMTIDAIYENGLLRPQQPLPLREHERVRITLQTEEVRVRQTQGLIGWQGAPDVVERVALSPLEDL
jgi:predicted DNA-binding antitoxin AbrB/MazE fold protein